MSTDTLYIDVTESVPDSIQADQNICFIYMPYLDFKSADDRERIAKERGYGFMNIPITLPVLDLIKQMEYAGVITTERHVVLARNAIRSMVIRILNGGE